MPCAWVPEIAKYLKQHWEVDSGLHLTLTSEWSLYRWLPVAGKPKVPGLVDAEGCLWRGVEQVATHATPDEIETEIRAQIDALQKQEKAIVTQEKNLVIANIKQQIRDFNITAAELGMDASRSSAGGKASRPAAAERVRVRISARHRR